MTYDDHNDDDDNDDNDDRSAGSHRLPSLLSSLHRGSFARSEHVGLATLHLDRIREACSEYVGLSTLHVNRMAQARSEHVGLTALHLDRIAESFLPFPLVSSTSFAMRSPTNIY